MIETTEEPPLRPDPPPRRWFHLMVLTGLLIVAVLASYPCYLWWQKRQLNSLIHQAEECLNKEQWDLAYLHLSEAYDQSPTNPAVLQKIARLTQRTNPEPARALFFWKQFVAYGSPTTEDWAEIGKAYIADGQPEEAIKILNSFSPEQRTSRYSIYLESQLLYFQGKTIEADTLRRQYLLTNPKDPENELNLAILDLANPFAEVQKTAFDTLWRIARAKNRQSATALQAISQSSLLTRGMSSELVSLASANDGVSTKKYFEILHQHLLLNPEKCDQVYETETVKYRDKPIQESALFYHWLLQQREYDRVLKLVPKENATRNELLFPVYVEALAGKARWTELHAIFRSVPSIPLSPTDQAVLQARIAHGQKEQDEIVSGHLKEASRRALTSKNMEALLRIVVIADELGFDDVAIEALRKASAIPQYQVDMLERLLGIYTRHGDTEAMLATIQNILEASPIMTSHLEASLYLKLLLGKEFESVSHNASLLARQGRISTQGFSFLNSLSAYRFRDLESLKDQLSKVEPGKLSAGQRAVYAGMLASCGEQAGAYAIAEKIPPTLLLQEELVFLRKAL